MSNDLVNMLIGFAAILSPILTTIAVYRMTARREDVNSRISMYGTCFEQLIKLKYIVVRCEFYQDKVNRINREEKNNFQRYGGLRPMPSELSSEKQMAQQGGMDAIRERAEYQAVLGKFAYIFSSTPRNNCEIQIHHAVNAVMSGVNDSLGVDNINILIDDACAKIVECMNCVSYHYFSIDNQFFRLTKLNARCLKSFFKIFLNCVNKILVFKR